METKKVLSKELFTFFSQSKQYQYKKEEIILRPDDTPSGVYYLEKGYIKSYEIKENGDENLQIIFKAGELFPLRWMFGYLHRQTFYEALTPVILRRMQKDEFMSFIKNNSAASYELLQRTIDMFNIYVERVDSLEFTSAYHRIVARLIALSHRFGELKGGKTKFSLPITHKDIANSINTSRETTSREIEILVRKGLIEEKNHVIAIINNKKLVDELTSFK